MRDTDVENLVTILWALLPAEKVAALKNTVADRVLPIPPAPSDGPSEARIRELEAYRKSAEDVIRTLEAQVSELASNSLVNETAYSYECNRSSAHASEAADLRRQLDKAHHTLVGISDARLEDWQALLERAETAEARVLALEHELEGCSHTQPAECSARLRAAEDRARHLESPMASVEGDSRLFFGDTYRKQVCEALATVPLDLLRSLARWENGGLSALARAELARRRAARRVGS